jgi:hypothetical protein
MLTLTTMFEALGIARLPAGECFLQYPFANHDRPDRCLRWPAGNGLAGSRPFFRVLPADQRFGTKHAAFAHITLGW